MFGSIKQMIRGFMGGPPLANDVDRFREERLARQREAKKVNPAEVATKRLEEMIGPFSQHPRMEVQSRAPSPRPSFNSSADPGTASTSQLTLPATNVASGSTSTLTPGAAQQNNKAPGSVPVKNVSDAQKSLEQTMRLLERSSSLKYKTEMFQDRCNVFGKLLEGMSAEDKSDSRFSYELTKINQDLVDIGSYLNDWNKKNKIRQAAARKDVHLQISRLERDFSHHLGLFMAIRQDQISKTDEQKMNDIGEKMDVLHSLQSKVRDQINLDNVDQVEDSELKRHVKDVTGFDPESSFILSRQIRYRENVRIGGGDNFDVYRGQMVDGESVAIKIYREKIQNDGKGVKFVDRMMRQVAFWTSFEHISILPCYGVGMQITRATEGFSSYDRFQFYLVSPFMRSGNAIQYIDKRRQDGVNVDILRIILQAAQGIQYLHDRESPCVHASMRGENVMIKDDGSACINGFGLTKALSATKPIELTGPRVQCRWMAPELLKGSNPPLLPSCDIWAWAMTALELLSGQQPYHNIQAPWEIPTAIVQGSTPVESDYPAFRKHSPQPDMMWALLQNCWKMNANERPKIESVINELDLIERAQIEQQAGHQWT